MAARGSKKAKKYEHLLLKEESGWLKIDKNEKILIKNFAKEYIEFLNNVKTEREAVEFIKEAAEKNGFISFKNLLKSKKVYAGQKIYAVNRNKSIILAIIGKEPLESGLNIICAHIDSPRLDLKQNPLYEDTELAYLKTHYYGGIKKYHWLNIPLAIHGKIVRLDGKVIDIKIGEKEDEPVFIIPDLLPHLSKKLKEKKISEAIPAENLNLLIGNIPISEKDQKDPVKIAILELLNKKYGIMESDFNSAEIEIVPAFKAREAGLDKSFIVGYGQDDRISSYATFKAIIETQNPQRTSIALLIDKEEIGSEGNSSIQSKFFEIFVSDLIEKISGKYYEKNLKISLAKSYGISADVDAAYDPNYKDVYDIRNTAKLGHGVIFTKYTGYGGKYDANDANAEYVGKLRKLFTENNVIFQFGELGKVDEGGGGTIAKYLANYGMEVIDCGPPVLGMHSPYELTSKFDLYQTFKGYKVFFQKIV